MPVKDNSAISLMWLSVTSVALGLMLHFSCVVLIGSGLATDAYFASQSIPMFISALLSGALVNNLMPAVAGLDGVRGQAFVQATLFQITLPLLILFGALAFSAQWWMPVIFTGLAINDQLSTNLAQIFCASAVAQVLLAIGVAGHCANKKFVFVEVVQMLTTLVALGLVSPIINNFGIIGFAWLLFARSVVSLLVINYHFITARRTTVNDLTIKLWKKTSQVISISSIYKTGSIIDRVLGSFCQPGVLTSLGIGQQLATASLSVSERVLARPLLVNAGKCLASSNGSELLVMYYKQLRTLSLVVGCIFCITIPITFFVLRGGKIFDVIDLNVFGRTDLILLIIWTIIPAAAGQLSSGLMYAIGDISSINRLAMVSFILSSIFKVFGFLYIGAYAIVGGIFLYQCLNWFFLHKVAVRTLHRSTNQSIGN